VFSTNIRERFRSSFEFRLIVNKIYLNMNPGKISPQAGEELNPEFKEDFFHPEFRECNTWRYFSEWRYSRQFSQVGK